MEKPCSRSKDSRIASDDLGEDLSPLLFRRMFSNITDDFHTSSGFKIGDVREKSNVIQINSMETPGCVELAEQTN